MGRFPVSTRIGLFVCAVFAATVGGEIAAQNQSADHPGQYSPSDIAAGAQLYTGQCANCHGTAGDAVGNVDLRRGRFRNATSDDDLKRVVKNGLPGTAMPAHNFNENELTSVVAYIRAGLDRNATAVMVGNATRGRTVFTGKGACANCHRVDGVGPYGAPDLSDVGAARTPASLQLSLLDPSSGMQPINRPVNIVMRDGKTIRGRRLNEDTYSIQLTDEKGNLVAVSKADVKTFDIVTTSPMPSYRGKLTSDEVADLVAYLMSLRG